MRTATSRGFALAGALALLGGCTAVGPNYVRPSAPVPKAYKEIGAGAATGPWTLARPQAGQPRGRWWALFHDPLLDRLESEVSISNQDLAQAAAQVREARALVSSARAGLYPQVTSSPTATRAGTSSAQGPGTVTSRLSLPVDVTWEADLWGRIGRGVESAGASAQASAADLESLRLSTQAELAQDYFQLRALDSQRKLFDQTVAAYRESLKLTRFRYESGVVAKADVVQAQTQLKTTQAQAVDLGVQRAQLEHAIALLVGKAPSELHIRPGPLEAVPPAPPPGVPSQLLERRPDIAAAERRVAAANADIGVAEAAFYPSVTLGASAGLQAADLARWFTLPSLFWSVGPVIAQTIADGGYRVAQTEKARAAYDGQVAAYRQTVLSGFREVEDNLSTLRILAHEADLQRDALDSARRSVVLTTNQYKAGTVSYLDVISAQTVALANERTALDIRSRRLVATVLLIKALGGGWNASDLPPAVSQAGTPAPSTP